jgi:hypothetical protein
VSCKSPPQRRCTIGLLLLLLASAALAGETASSLIDAGMPANCAPFAARVSASEGSFGSTNQANCVGAFQFCPGTFEAYYSGSRKSFLTDPSSQVSAWTKYEQNSWARAQRNGLTSLLGQQVCSAGQCVTIDRSAILMACQFGCGGGGKLANYVAGGDCGASNVKDGNGVSVCSYLVRGAGFDVSCFTGKGADCSIDDVGDFPATVSPPDNDTLTG